MGAYGGYSYPSGGNGGKKKKVAIIGVSSILLVAMVVALAVGVNRKGGESGAAPANQISASTKAIKTICQPTDYKETCETTLSSAAGNTSDPKELIKVAFNVAVKNIGDAIKNSSLLQEASKDPEIADAIKTCHELLNLSIADLKKSFEKIGAFDISKLDDYVADLKTWLSGAITYQQTCLDGFENTTGDAGQKMKKLLKTSGELTSNGLAMVTEISTLISSLQIPGLNRRLLNTEEPDIAADGFPSWVSESRRNLLQATPANIRPNVVVAKDGSGKYRTINQALKDIPKKGNKPFVIYIKAGVYAEYLDFTSHMTNVMLLGDGPTKTKITGSRSKVGGYNTYRTATVAASGDHFMAKNIGFENTAGSAKHQAVALRVSADMSIIYNCQIDGYQDTLYAHTHRQFYRDCTISGTVDFVFGDAASVFQNCKLVVRMPLPNQMCMVTAQGRHDRRATTGIVLQNCTITAERKLAAAKPAIRSFLGRPWKNYSRTIIMNSHIDKVIDPEGWFPWAGTVHLDTLWYAEFNNRGPGSAQNRRVKWRGIKKVNAQQLAAFTPGKFLRGDTWIPVTGVPYKSGM